MVLIRILGVIGGPEAEVRCCTCEACAATAGAVRYVSRRSEEWTVLGERVDPARLEVETAFRGAGIRKRRPAGGELLLLQPCQLVCVLEGGAGASPRLASLPASTRLTSPRFSTLASTLLFTTPRLVSPRLSSCPPRPASFAEGSSPGPGGALECLPVYRIQE